MNSFPFLYQFHYWSVFNAVTRGKLPRFQETDRAYCFVQRVIATLYEKRKNRKRKKPLWKNRIVRCAAHTCGKLERIVLGASARTRTGFPRTVSRDQSFRETSRVAAHRYPPMPPDSYRTSEKEAPPLECRSSANIDDREGFNEVNDTRWLSLPWNIGNRWSNSIK